MTVRRFVSWGAFAVLVLGAATSFAEIKQVNEESLEAHAYSNVNDSDLINQGQSTLARHQRSPTGHFGDNTNDGGARHGSSDDCEYWPNTEQPNTLTYTLDTTAHPRGYDINTIRIVTGWINAELSQANQDFELFVRKVGSSDFTSLGSFHHKPYPDEHGGPYSIRVTLTDDTGTIASGVDAVRFTFEAASHYGKHPGLVICEIDVEGDATD